MHLTVSEALNLDFRKNTDKIESAPDGTGNTDDDHKNTDKIESDDDTNKNFKSGQAS